MDGAILSLAVAVGRALVDRGAMCATAESCTGGLVAGAITDIPGSSAWFDRGFVTYTNDAKTEMLDVPAAVLAVHGAVSEATARAMVAGALTHSAATYAVAITGVAGPGGGSPDKPVGLVCFAWAQRGGHVETAAHRFPGDRAEVRRASVVTALAGLHALVCAR